MIKNEKNSQIIHDISVFVHSFLLFIDNEQAFWLNELLLNALA